MDGCLSDAWPSCIFSVHCFVQEVEFRIGLNGITLNCGLRFYAHYVFRPTTTDCIKISVLAAMRTPEPGALDSESL